MRLFNPVFAHAEYQVLSAKDLYDFEGRELVQRLPLGGGISQRIGGNSYVNIMVLYDVLYNPNSQYNLLNNSFNGFIIRAGVSLGL